MRRIGGEWTAACCVYPVFHRLYRLKHAVTATAIDDHGHARFPDDTSLPAASEFYILTGKHTWAPHPDSKLFYTIEYRNVRYNVQAEELEPAMEPAA